MNLRLYIIAILCFFLTAAGSVSGETVLENPSFYSFAEVEQKLPELWLAQPHIVDAIMDLYPDFVCLRSYDLMGCRSVNNKYSPEIRVNFRFSSGDDDAELIGTVFPMMINTPEDVQKVIEAFWLPEMKAAHIMGSAYGDEEVTLYFSSENTLMKVSVPWGEDGSVRMITVDIGLIRG